MVEIAFTQPIEALDPNEDKRKKIALSEATRIKKNRRSKAFGASCDLTSWSLTWICQFSIFALESLRFAIIVAISTVRLVSTGFSARCWITKVARCFTLRSLAALGITTVRIAT